MNRYERNGILTAEEMKILKAANVCVVGCGGLGGYIIEMLGRIGIGTLTIVDGDFFDESNLNRQLISTTNNLGKYKVQEVKKRMNEVNPDVDIITHQIFLTSENAVEIISGCDVVIDALDSIESRRVLQVACEGEVIPMIHGAIAGWYGQVTTIMPGDRTLDRLYSGNRDSGVEAKLGNPSFTPAIIASIQVSEAVKLLTNKDELLRSKILHVDLLFNEFYVLDK